MRTATVSHRVDQMPVGPRSVSVPSEPPRKPRAARRHAGHPLVIEEELFRGLLIKERKRADRSNQSVALLLVGVNARLGPTSPALWAPVIEAVNAVTRETDVLGWFETDAVLGIMLPEIGAFDAAHACEIEARIWQALAARSEVDATERFSIQLHAHPAPKGSGGEERWPLAPLDFPALHSRQERGTIYDAIKRTLDIICSVILLAALSPLLLSIAVAVKLSSRGRVLFGQVRIGQKMKPFTMLKFRTMYTGADQTLHHTYATWFVTSSGETCGGDKGQLFKLTNDPRVTPVGRLLRKTSLDELPQLLNVLRGEMSLVGPRPPLSYEVEQYKPWHCRRVLEAKPGITGLWQVMGRSRTTFDQMVRLDLRYVRTCSLWTDIRILLATPRAVINGKGAC